MRVGVGAVAVRAVSNACRCAPVALTAVLFACSSGGTAAPTAPNVEGFVGTWSCTVTDDVTYVEPPGRPPIHTTFSAVLAITRSGSDQVTIASSTVQGCPPRVYSVSGDTATIVSGLTCATPSGDQTVTVDNATFTVSGDTLTGTSSGSTSNRAVTPPEEHTSNATHACKRGAPPPDAGSGSLTDH